MITIWKFATPLYDIAGENVIYMPRDAEVLSVGAQGLDLCLWARVDADATKDPRYFAFVGTGHPAPRDGRFLGTATFNGPPNVLVIHAFELGQGR